MAAGDIASVTIRADGCTADVAIAGLATGGTYDWGTFDDTPPTSGTPKVTFTVVSEGYTSAGVLSTVTRTVYGTKVVEWAPTTYRIAGSFTAGTFADGEIVTQATTSAKAYVVNAQSAGAYLYVSTATTTPAANTTDVWTGGTSGATFTPTATPSAVTDGTNNEMYNGTNLIVRIALSEYIYADDKNGGAGTSGTNPTVTIAAAWVTSGGTPNNVATALSCTNSSAETYPLCLGQWDAIAGVRTADRVTGSFDMAFQAYHRLGVKAVRLTAAGLTSLYTAEAYVTSQTATVRSATGLYSSAYKTTIPIAGFTSGESIDLRAVVYPVVGDAAAVLDTDSYTTDTEECRGRNKATIVYNTTQTIRYVSPSGNDANDGLGTSTPYLTLGKAIEASGGNATLIYLMAGTHLGFGKTITRRTTSEWVVVTPAPGESASTVTFQFAATNKTYRTQRLQFLAVTLDAASTSSYPDGEATGANFLRFKNCVFNSTVVGQISPTFSYRSYGTYIENCTGDLSYANWRLAHYSTERNAYQLDGVVIDEGTGAATSCCDGVYRMVACDVNGRNGINEKPSAAASPTQENLVVAFNRFRNFDSTSQKIFVISSVSWQIADGIAIIGNVFEKTAGTSPLMSIAADSSSLPAKNVIVWHNTLAGERANLAYNEFGGTARLRNQWSVKNNAFRDLNIKEWSFAQAITSLTRVGTTATCTVTAGHGLSTGDIMKMSNVSPSGYNGNYQVTVSSSTVFTYTMASDPGASGTGGSCGQHPLRTGNTGPLYGCGYEGNVCEINLFTARWLGLQSELVGNDGIAYTDNASYTGDGTGAGDYHTAAGSQLDNRISTPVIPYDMEGNTFPVTGFAGAYGETAGSSGFITENPWRRRFRRISDGG